jgi:hypothetical protein
MEWRGRWWRRSSASESWNDWEGCLAIMARYPFYASVVIVIRLACKCMLSDYFWFLMVTVALAFWNNLR